MPPIGEILRSGWLSKRPISGSAKVRWRRHFFVLTQGRIFWFPSDKRDAKAVGSLDLTDGSSRVVNTAGRANCFEVHVLGKRLVLKCNSTEDARLWVCDGREVVRSFRRDSRRRLVAG